MNPITHFEPSENAVAFPRRAPEQQGMDTPMYVSEYGHEHPGVAMLTLRGGEETVLVVGPAGVAVYQNVWAWLDGAAPLESHEADSLPADGWTLASTQCLSTGGMCMVDVLRFANGAAMTVSAECAALYAPNAELLDDEPALAAQR